MRMPVELLNTMSMKSEREDFSIPNVTFSAANTSSLQLQDGISYPS